MVAIGKRKTDHRRRIEVWDRYNDLSKSLEDQGRLRRPYVPEDWQHNGDLYYVLVPDLAPRDETLAALKKQGIQSVVHYVPLHSSPAGKSTAVFMVLCKQLNKCPPALSGYNFGSA